MADSSQPITEKPLLLLVAGANGSGKTTFAKHIAELNNLPFVNADETAREINPDDVRAARFQAGREVLKELETLRERRISFVYESTLAGLSLSRILNEFKNVGYEISLVYVYLDSADVCIERIKSRVRAGGHFVPDDEVRRRYERSKRNFIEVYRLIADQWLLYRNPLEGFELIATQDEAAVKIWNKERTEQFFGHVLENINVGISSTSSRPA